MSCTTKPSDRREPKPYEKRSAQQQRHEADKQPFHILSFSKQESLVLTQLGIFQVLWQPFPAISILSGRYASEQWNGKRFLGALYGATPRSCMLSEDKT